MSPTLSTFKFTLSNIKQAELTTPNETASTHFMEVNWAFRDIQTQSCIRGKMYWNLNKKGSLEWSLSGEGSEGSAATGRTWKLKKRRPQGLTLLNQVYNHSPPRLKTSHAKGSPVFSVTTLHFHHPTQASNENTLSGKKNHIWWPPGWGILTS